MKKYIKLALLPLILSGTALDAVQPSKGKTVNFSIVISGGVSLGAYESGYNWAMIKLLSKAKNSNLGIRPELKSAAGASAGSINALLSAMYWCQRDDIDYKNSIDNNLFYETWVNLDIKDLIITDPNSPNKSTLFDRRELKNKADQIIRHLQESVYRKNCEVPMGFAVTKVTPIVENFNGVEIKNQNFSIPLTLKEQNGKMSIHNKLMPPSYEFYISIPGIEDNITKIADVLFASSAFPGAFEQVKLEYVYKGTQRTSYFIDGGVYANTPLQLAIELNKEANHFIFIDPSNMRKEPKPEEEDTEEQPPLGFVSTNATPLSDSAGIFQQMKLYQAINQNFRDNPDYHLILSSRFHPITGKFMEHFGAFMDKNFRIYDYYAGIYDALYHFASALHKRGLHKDKSQIDLMKIAAKDLGVYSNKDALDAFELFLATEFSGKVPHKDNRFASIYYAFDRSATDEKKYGNDQFKQFLQNLDMRYLPVKNDSFVYYARKDINHWYKRPIRYIVNRVTDLENYKTRVHPDNAPISSALNASAWIGSTFVKEKEGFDILPINAPHDPDDALTRNILRAIPTEFAADTKNGGLSIAYEAYWYGDLGFLSGLELKPSYNFNDDVGDFVRVDINGFYEYDDFIKFGAGVSGFGNTEEDFYDRDSAYGANLYVDFLDVLRATYVKRHGDIEEDTYFYLGIENIPSLLYWLYR